MSRSGEWFETEDGDVFWWPRCEIPGCSNFICFRRSQRFCWPHSGSGEPLDTMIKKHKHKKIPERVP